MLPVIIQRCVAISCMPLAVTLLSLAESKPRPDPIHANVRPCHLLAYHAHAQTQHMNAYNATRAHILHVHDLAKSSLLRSIYTAISCMRTRKSQHHCKNSVRTNAKYVVCTAVSALSLHTLTQNTLSARQRPACAPTCPPGAAPPAACSRSWHASCGTRPASSLRWFWSVAGSALRARRLAAPHSSCRSRNRVG